MRETMRWCLFPLLAMSGGCEINPCPPGTYEFMGRCELIDAPDGGADATVDGGDSGAVSCEPSQAATQCVLTQDVAATACTNGQCAVGMCREGRLDCDQQYANGCELALGSEQACSGCGDVCAWDCDAGHCDDVVQVVTSPTIFGFGTKDSACVLRQSATVACWGNNDSGQLGDGTMDSRSRARAIEGLRDVASLASGASTWCALHLGGTVSCWGWAAGNGAERTTRPTRVAGLTDVIQLDGGGYSICALRRDGSVWCWHGTELPARVEGLPPAQSVSAGMFHECAVAAGEAWCWSKSTGAMFGEVDESTRSEVRAPVRVGGGTVRSVVAGAATTCVLAENGVVYCRGIGVGDGTASRRAMGAVPGPVDVQLLFGDNGQCARTADGKLWCWGVHRPGDGTSRMPEQLRLAEEMLHLASASQLSLGMVNCGLFDGALRCWGHNGEGEVGDGTLEERLVPTAVLSPE